MNILKVHKVRVPKIVNKFLSAKDIVILCKKVLYCDSYMQFAFVAHIHTVLDVLCTVCSIYRSVTFDAIVPLESSRFL